MNSIISQSYIYSGMKQMLRPTERISQPHDELAPDIQRSKTILVPKGFTV